MGIRRVAITLLLDMSLYVSLVPLNITNTIWNFSLTEINFSTIKIPKTSRMFNSRGKKPLHMTKHFLYRERSSTRQMRNLWIHHCQKPKLFLSSRNIFVLYSGPKTDKQKDPPKTKNQTSKQTK